MKNTIITVISAIITFTLLQQYNLKADSISLLIRPTFQVWEMISISLIVGILFRCWMPIKNF